MQEMMREQGLERVQARTAVDRDPAWGVLMRVQESLHVAVRPMASRLRNRNLN